MAPLFRWLFALGLIAIAAGWWLSRPTRASDAELAGLAVDLARGEVVFNAGGCASCHSAEGAEGEAKLILSGGRAFPSDFGTFYAPNISPDPQAGIGGWSAVDLVTAMQHGVSPEGRHYYPAFPYTAYVRAPVADIVSLRAYLATLPSADTASRPHDVGFPFNIRRSLGLWKRLFLRKGWVVSGDLTDEQIRGRDLAEGLAHCGECHSPRNLIGGIVKARWLAGAPNPTGKGRIPNITPAALDWSAEEIVEFLTTGFTPDFDTAGGHMVAVIENLAKLPDPDRAAIAAYLKAVPPSK